MVSKKALANQERHANAIKTLQTVADSNITPRNIRKIVKDSIVILNDSSLSLSVRAANAISMLDEASQDPNMPSFARVTLWTAVSSLEAIRE
ncbi:MAG: UPF0147 family protein [Thaumarchaeota archaeon]|nr:UPF0147 family protein [Nitrososphaerota archaeon]